MELKIFLDMFLNDYKRLRKQNGSVAVMLDTDSTEVLAFVKKLPMGQAMPPISQVDMDNLQLDFGRSATIIDWFESDWCRFFIMMLPQRNPARYKLVLNAFFDDEAIQIIGEFSEKHHQGFREKLYNEHFMDDDGDSLMTETDFTMEDFDEIVPNDPLSLCRRLANLIAGNATCCERGTRKIDSNN